MPGVDLDDQTEGNSGQLVDLLKKQKKYKTLANLTIAYVTQVYNGLERSVPLSLGYTARLIEPVDQFDNTSVKKPHFLYAFLQFFTFIIMIKRFFTFATYPAFSKVVICDTGLCEGRDFEIVVQFEASPEPDEVGE